MEQFGLWNLLKSVLSVGQGQPNNGDFHPSPPPPKTEKTERFTPPQTKENACGQYLLRHETLRQKRK